MPSQKNMRKIERRLSTPKRPSERYFESYAHRRRDFVVKTTCRKPRLSEYGLRVRLTSVGDGVPQGVEYRPPVGACSDAGPASYEGVQPVKIGSISQDFFNIVEGDRELMLKHNRPCIVVARLRFHGKRRDFAVPPRSNIAPVCPKTSTLRCHPAPRRAPAAATASTTSRCSP